MTLVFTDLLGELRGSGSGNGSSGGFHYRPDSRRFIYFSCRRCVTLTSRRASSDPITPMAAECRACSGGLWLGQASFPSRSPQRSLGGLRFLSRPPCSPTTPCLVRETEPPGPDNPSPYVS